MSNRQTRVEYLCAELDTVASLEIFLPAQEALNFRLAGSHRCVLEPDPREIAPFSSHGMDSTPVRI
jgi:hypothetical protein